MRPRLEKCLVAFHRMELTNRMSFHQETPLTLPATLACLDFREYLQYDQHTIESSPQQHDFHLNAFGEEGSMAKDQQPALSVLMMCPRNYQRATKGAAVLPERPQSPNQIQSLLSLSLRELLRKAPAVVVDCAAGPLHPGEVQVAVCLHLSQNLHGHYENIHSVHNRSWGTHLQSAAGMSPLMMCLLWTLMSAAVLLKAQLSGLAVQHLVGGHFPPGPDCGRLVDAASVLKYPAFVGYPKSPHGSAEDALQSDLCCGQEHPWQTLDSGLSLFVAPEQHR